MCFAPSNFGAGGPNQNTCVCGLVPGVPTKTCLESSTKKFKPHFISGAAVSVKLLYTEIQCGLNFFILGDRFISEDPLHGGVRGS